MSWRSTHSTLFLTVITHAHISLCLSIVQQAFTAYRAADVALIRVTAINLPSIKTTLLTSWSISKITGYCLSRSLASSLPEKFLQNLIADKSCLVGMGNLGFDPGSSAFQADAFTRLAYFPKWEK